MDYIIKCTEEQKEILQVALYEYLNSYRERLNKIEDVISKEKVEEKLKITEKMLNEIEA